jgi:murein DD-endopeptidase
MVKKGRWPGQLLASLLVMSLLLAALGVPVTVGPVGAASPARAKAVVAAALEYLGRPYKFGAEGPNALDCSGLVFRAFSDAGQLKAVGNARMRAVGYLRWFEQRGLATHDESLAERGDLIVYADGEHIGIYLGRGEVVSALTTSGITVHRLHGINWAFSHVLKVDWSMGHKPILPIAGNEEDDDGSEESVGDTAGIPGLATGSLYLRAEADPASQVIGVVSRGSRFTVVGAGRSPSGSLWLQVTTDADATGWIWSQFTELPDGTDVESLADSDVLDEDEPADDAAEEAIGIATGALNVRAEPDPEADIVGWLPRGSQFRILGGATSPGGWLWLNVETESGTSGWIWSKWTEYPSEILAPDGPDGPDGPDDAVYAGEGNPADDVLPEPEVNDSRRD